MQVDDLHIVPCETRDGGSNVVQRDGAHFAEVLRDDHVRLCVTEPLDVDLVNRESVPEHVADRGVDRAARGQRADAGARQRRYALEPRRVVALVASAYELLAGAEGTDDLGRGREQRDDAHRPRG